MNRTFGWRGSVVSQRRLWAAGSNAFIKPKTTAQKKMSREPFAFAYMVRSENIESLMLPPAALTINGSEMVENDRRTFRGLAFGVRKLACALVGRSLLRPA